MRPSVLWPRSVAGLLVAVLVGSPACALDAVAARGYLLQAAAAAREIQFPGDQSAARREITLALMQFDLAAARESAAGLGRTSDGARALAEIAAALAQKDPTTARQTAALGGRLVQRITEPDRRAEEYRLFLRTIAPLGADAPEAAPEVPPSEARPLVVAALAASDSERALALADTWNLKPPATDDAYAALAPRLASTKPEEALALADRIASPELRDRTLWRVAEARPVPEAQAIAARLQDPVLRAGVLTSAALRLAPTDPAAAWARAGQVEVSPASAQAQVAVAAARGEEGKGVALARQLSEPTRAWALGEIAQAVAATEPERAEAYLQEAGGGAELTELVAARLAPADPERARRLAGALAGVDRDTALLGVVRALAPEHLSLARDLVPEIQAPELRDQALAAVACQLAKESADAATAVLGLVSDPARLLALRAQIAAVAAAREPAAAQRLLGSLPPGEARTWWSYAAGRARLSTGSPEEAVALAKLGLSSDLARRWLLPEAVRAKANGAQALGDRLDDSYWRSLAFVGAARVVLEDAPRPRPAPERARLLRPIVEWEGM